MIRRAARADLEELLAIAEQSYARYGQSFDKAQARVWANKALDNPDLVILRSDGAAIVASLSQAFWGGPRRAYMLFLFGGDGRVWEVLALLREADKWRREKGAESFHFGEETGFDFAPLARRIGAKLDRPCYRIEGGAKAVRSEPWRVLSAALAGGRAGALAQALRV